MPPSISCAGNTMEVQKDYKELFEYFNAHKVAYIVVGAYALAFHGAPRFSGDIDIYVQPSLKNAENISAALRDFGFQSLGFSVEDFSKPDQVIQLGVTPVRIDIMTSITGVSWEEAYNDKVEAMYGDTKIYYLGKRELVKNKRALGRKKDMADLESLGEDL